VLLRQREREIAERVSRYPAATRRRRLARKSLEHIDDVEGLLGLVPGVARVLQDCDALAEELLERPHCASLIVLCIARDVDLRQPPSLLGRQDEDAAPVGRGGQRAHPRAPGRRLLGGGHR
jgi:hypothetical protein